MNAALPWARLAAALAILWVLLTYIGPMDLADEYIREAMEKEMRVERVKRAELLCDCAKVHEGRWLRLYIAHQPDRELCQAVCVYSDGTLTEGTL